MAYPATTNAAVPVVTSLATTIPGVAIENQSFALGTTTLYEVDSSGAATTTPLGQSGPFVVTVDNEQILCSSSFEGVCEVYENLGVSGRGWASTTVASHTAGVAAVSITATSVQSVGPVGTALLAANDLSDVANAAIALGHLGGVPVVFTMTGAAAPDGFVQNPATFNSVVDPIWQIGYNIANISGHVAAEPQWYMGIEGNYRILAGTEGWDNLGPHNINEWYVNRTSPDGTTVVNFRPIYVGVLRDSNSSHAAHVIFDIGTAGFPNSQLEIQAGTFVGQAVPFSATYAAAPGKYIVGIQSTSASSKLGQGTVLGGAGGVSSGTNVPATVTPAAASACNQMPILSTY